MNCPCHSYGNAQQEATGSTENSGLPETARQGYQSVGERGRTTCVRLIDNLFGRGGEPPEWASCFKGGDFNAFVSDLKRVLDARGAPYELDTTIGTVRMIEEGDEGSVFGLANVAQICHQNPRRVWPEILKGHFERMIGHLAQSESVLARYENDFEEARQVMKVRLYPSDAAGLDYTQSHSPAPGITAALVYDLPESVVSVHKDHVAKWGVPVDELFKIGMENVRAEEGIVADTLDLGNGSALYTLMGDSFFTASHALLLGERLKPAPEMGALVAIPHRHTVIYHPIHDEAAMEALNAMIPMAIGMFQEGPGSISPHLYWWREAAWWHEGEFTLLPTEVKGRTVEFTPPGEFVEKVLSRLG